MPVAIRAVLLRNDEVNGAAFEPPFSIDPPVRAEVVHPMRPDRASRLSVFIAQEKSRTLGASGF
ncbi:hypothetical protein [Rhizobium lentis]|uniref:Uncharacterized protein n=1 Tax=Rhizobium lentis TaxID=1138194 RepID=A0A9Q3QW35_9HYPH|nr:hypothetical protein [Rhizobium lentis]MBX4954218.1 hypothetical protein [Rhizobium lentis]MBX4972250.1 hypothetical protein [Rhizobium lentis]MBX4984232.1 hypothetical protein [Rhizobium lentis]MBX4996788.1 hypothetical protein [Rhizobium lentis]MBX5002746.1 hypothetical protein [Rhizobium lentis]